MSRKKLVSFFLFFAFLARPFPALSAIWIFGKPSPGFNLPKLCRAAHSLLISKYSGHPSCWCWSTPDSGRSSLLYFPLGRFHNGATRSWSSVKCCGAKIPSFPGELNLFPARPRSWSKLRGTTELGTIFISFLSFKTFIDFKIWIKNMRRCQKCRVDSQSGFWFEEETPRWVSCPIT